MDFASVDPVDFVVCGGMELGVEWHLYLWIFHRMCWDEKFFLGEECRSVEGLGGPPGGGLDEGFFFKLRTALGDTPQSLRAGP